jgi:hypothetical protein
VQCTFDEDSHTLRIEIAGQPAAGALMSEQLPTAEFRLSSAMNCDGPALMASLSLSVCSVQMATPVAAAATAAAAPPAPLSQWLATRLSASAKELTAVFAAQSIGAVSDLMGLSADDLKELKLSAGLLDRLNAAIAAAKKGPATAPPSTASVSA